MPINLISKIGSIKWTRIICFILYLLCFDICAPKLKAEENFSPSGLGVHVQISRTSPEQLSAIKNAGFEYLRWGVDWNNTETVKGKYHWVNDEWVAETKARGFKSVVMLINGNWLYSESKIVPKDNLGLRGFNAYAPYDALSVKAFADFAAATVKHYGAQDFIYEIWNEPDIANRFWLPRSSAKQYAELAVAACKAIKKAVPEAFVAGPASASMPGLGAAFGKPEFTQALFEEDQTHCLDGISFHSYRYKSGHLHYNLPETIVSDNEMVREYVDHSRGTTEKKAFLLCTEWGYPTNLITLESQADHLLRAYLLNRLSDVPLTIWYEWQDRPLAYTSDDEAFYGLVTSKNVPKPAMAKLQLILNKLKGLQKITRIDTNDQSDYVLKLFFKDGRQSVAFWTMNLQHAEQKQIYIAFGNGAGVPLKKEVQFLDLVRDEQENGQVLIIQMKEE